MKILNIQKAARQFLDLGTALMLALILGLACFIKAGHPIIAEAAAEDAAKEPAAPLLSFDGYAKGVVDGDRIIVTDARGAKHEFTWVDEGIRKTVDGAEELSEPIPQGDYVSPAEAALHAAETAVTVYGDAIPACEIHVNMYTGNGLELVYYGIGFNGTPFENIDLGYGYIDATTGTVLCLDMNYYGRIVKQYGEDAINGKIRDSWNWTGEQYANEHTSEKALATAMELICTCFPTGEIVPEDPAVWEAGSHTDGEQIEWAGGYVALVDAYIRMDKDPCYYVQVAVPLEEGAEPAVTIFGCYPLGWDYCCNQIHDPAVLREELADREAIRNGTQNTNDGAGEPVTTSLPAQDLLGMNADRAEALQGTVFTPMAEEWKEGDSAEEFSKVFLVRIDVYPDDGYESSEPMHDPDKVAALAQRGNVLRFVWGDQVRYAVYLGDGLIVYADAEKDRMVRNAYVADWLNDKEGKPNCTCSILTWR